MKIQDYYDRNYKLYTDDAYLERLFLDNVFYPEFHEAGLDHLQYQKPIYDPYYDQKYYIDYVIELNGGKYAIELDGYSTHGIQPKDAFEKEKEKSNEITRQGYELIRYTYDKIKYCPKQVRKELRERLPLSSIIQQDGGAPKAKPIGQPIGSGKEDQSKPIVQSTAIEKEGQQKPVIQPIGSNKKGKIKPICNSLGSNKEVQTKHIGQSIVSEKEGQSKPVAHSTVSGKEDQSKPVAHSTVSGKEDQSKSYYSYKKEQSGGCRNIILWIIVILIALFLLNSGKQYFHSTSQNTHITPTNNNLTGSSPTSTKMPENTSTPEKIIVTSTPTKKPVPTKTPTPVNDWLFENEEIRLKKGERVQENIIFPNGSYFRYDHDCLNIADVSYQNPNRYLTIIGLSPGTCTVKLQNDNRNDADELIIKVTSK